jgi:hypothetical protein
MDPPPIFVSGKKPRPVAIPRASVLTLELFKDFFDLTEEMETAHDAT